MAANPSNSQVPAGGIEKPRRETNLASSVKTAAAVVPTCNTSLALGIAPPSNHGKIQTVATATKSDAHSRAKPSLLDSNASGTVVLLIVADRDGVLDRSRNCIGKSS